MKMNQENKNKPKKHALLKYTKNEDDLKKEETFKNKVKMKIGDEDDKRVWLKLQLLYLIQSSTNPPSIQRVGVVRGTGEEAGEKIVTVRSGYLVMA